MASFPKTICLDLDENAFPIPFVPYYHQYLFLNSTRQVRCLIGGYGCLGGEALIYNPITGNEIKVEELYLNNKPFPVLAKNGDSTIITMAEPPIRFDKEDIYEVTFSNGRKIQVTQKHVFLTHSGWKRLCDFEHDEFLPLFSQDPPASILDTSLLMSLEDDQRLKKINQDSLGSHLTYHHQYGEQLLPSQDISQFSLPLLNDLLEYIHNYCWDAQALKSIYIPFDILSHLAKKDFCHLYGTPCFSASPHYSLINDEPLHRHLKQEVEVYQLSHCKSSPIHKEFLSLLISAIKKIFFSLPYRSLLSRMYKKDTTVGYGNTVAKIEYLRNDYYYDFCVPEYHNYYAAGVWNHNSAKTSTSCIELIKKSNEYNGIVCLSISPTYKMARNNVVDTIKKVCEASLIPYEFNSGQMEFTFKNKSKIIVLSGESGEEKIKGINATIVHLDEVFVMDKSVYLQSLARIRYKDPKGIILSGTPEGVSNWGADLIAENQNNKDWLILEVTTMDNLSLSEQYIKTLRENYTEEQVQAYIYGKFISLNTNLAYYKFSKSVHCCNKEINPYKDLYISCDWNVHPLTGVFIQQEGDIDYVVDEIWLENSNIDKLCDTIRNKTKNHKGNLILTGDPTGKNRSIYNDYGAFNTIKTTLADLNLKIEIPPVMRQIDSMNLLNSRFQNAEKKIRLYVDYKCNKLIRDLERTLVLPDGTIDKKTDPMISHIGDGLKYFVNCFRQYSKYSRTDL